MSMNTTLAGPGAGKIGRRLVTAAVTALIITGLATLAGRFGQIAWPFELLSHFTVQFLALQATGLAVLMLCGRHHRLALVFLPFPLINLMLVAPYMLFPAWRAEAAGGPTRLTVLSANIHYSNHRVDLLQAEIARIDPDVIVLIEPTVDWYDDQSPQRAHYPNVIFHRDGAGTGIMMASRIPWERASTFALSSPYSPSVYATFCPAPERGPAGCVDLLGVHPISPIGAQRSHMRDAELEAIADFVRQHGPERFVVLGDFNTTPWSVRFSELIERSGLAESPIGRGLTATWMSKSPLFGLPIDHVLVGRDIHVVRQAVGDDIGSDHYPVSATLAF